MSPTKSKRGDTSRPIPNPTTTGKAAVHIINNNTALSTPTPGRQSCCSPARLVGYHWLGGPGPGLCLRRKHAEGRWVWHATNAW